MSFLLPRLRTTTTQRLATRTAIQTLANLSTTRSFSHTPRIMGVTKTIISEGSGPSPRTGDRVTIEYTGWLKDESKPDNKGAKFDSSVGRGAFITEIGVGKVIRGWDEGVTQMKLGEKATLDITSDYAYGDRGFTDLIPPRSTLIFDVHLQRIN